MHTFALVIGNAAIGFAIGFLCGSIVQYRAHQDDMTKLRKEYEERDKAIGGNMKSKTKGKWLQESKKIIWYCSNCWQQGKADIQIENREIPPTYEDIQTMIRLTCHTECHEPNIRLVQ